MNKETKHIDMKPQNKQVISSLPSSTVQTNFTQQSEPVESLPSSHTRSNKPYGFPRT